MADDQLTDKDRVARAFLRGLASYDQEAVVQGSVNGRLLEIISSFAKTKVPVRRVLEVGCCTGMLTEATCRLLQPDEYFLNDLVPQFFQAVQDRLAPELRSRLRPCFGDIERCNVPEEIDVVVSSSTLQWLDNLEAFFGRIARILTGNGRLVFSMFGRETLGEVTELTGVGLSYPSFSEVRDLLELRFRIHHSDVVRDKLFFATPLDVLRHIQATGVGGVGGYAWTPRRIERFAEKYRERFSGHRGVELSYVSYLFAADKR